MLIGMILETLGIGLIIPTLALMTDYNAVSKYPVIQPLIEHLGGSGLPRLIIVGMAILVCTFFLKTAFLAFLAVKQTKFVFSLQASLSQQLFAIYLRQPYSFHLERNSAQLIHSAITEINQLIFGTILPGITLLTEVLVLGGIGALLILVEPFGAISVISILGLVGWIFHQNTRTRLLRWGKGYQEHEGLRIQHLQQGLGGAKDVKLLGREDEFLNQYAIHNEAVALFSGRKTVLESLPRILLELLAVAALAILVITMLAQGRPIETLVPILGFFAAAAFRLMPSVSRIFNCVQNLRYSLPVVTTLHREFQRLGQIPEQNCVSRFPLMRNLQLNLVTYIYPNCDRPTIKDLSLTIPMGISVGFFGGSGAGKSTLIDVLLGLLTPTEGQVLVDGVDIQSNLRGWQNQIGYVPQNIYLTDDTLRRNVAFGLAEERIDDRAVTLAIKAAHLQEFVYSLPEGLNTLVGERGIRLSGGQRQRIGIARALYHDPAILVLDEATSSLDATTEQDVMRTINELQGQKTKIIVAHRMSTLSRCEKMYRLDSGKIVFEGAFEELQSNI